MYSFLVWAATKGGEFVDVGDENEQASLCCRIVREAGLVDATRSYFFSPASPTSKHSVFATSFTALH